MKKLHTSIVLAVVALALFAGTTMAYNPIIADDTPGAPRPTALFSLDWKTNVYHGGDGAVIRHNDSYVALFNVAVEQEEGHFLTVEVSPTETYRVPMEVFFYPEGSTYGQEQQVILDAIEDSFGIKTQAALAVIDSNSELWSLVGQDVNSIYFGSVEEGTVVTVENMYFYRCFSCNTEWLHRQTGADGWQTWLKAIDGWVEEVPYDHAYLTP